MFNLFKKKTADKSICAFASGQLKSIDKCIDPVFSEKMMGDGCLITPTDNKIVSPVDGYVAMLFPTMHAIGLKDENQNEYLIHIGVETVSLQGKGFISFVKTDQKVKKGDLLIEVDFNSIKDKVSSIDVILIATDNRKCTQLNESTVVCGQDNIATFE